MKRESPAHYHPTLQARDFQMSVRMLLLLYALMIVVKQSPQVAKVRARQCLQVFVSLAPPGCRLHLPIMLGDQWHHIVVNVDKDCIINPPQIWHQFLEAELGLQIHAGLSVVFAKLVDPGAISYRQTGFHRVGSARYRKQTVSEGGARCRF